MKIENLSKFRTELMGFAMLLVVWHHLPMFMNNALYGILKDNAGFGVDIFVLLSGMGLYYSASKHFNIRDYFKKRVIRIFPIYAFVILCVLLLKGTFDFQRYVLLTTTVGYWTHGICFDWFIPNLILMYILFPLFYKIIEKKILYGILVIILLWSIIYCLPDGENFQALYRFPVFFLGVIVGKYLINRILPPPISLHTALLVICMPSSHTEHTSGIYINKTISIIILIAFVIGIGLVLYGRLMYYQPILDPFELPLLKYNGWLFIPYIFLVVYFCVLITNLFTISFLKFLNPIWNLFGSMSIEVYLLHGQFIILTRYVVDTYGLSKSLVGFVLVMLSFVLSYYLHIANKYVMELLSSKGL